MAVAVLATGSGVALAAAVTINDARGDTNSRIDIRKVVVRHTDDRLKVKARLNKVVYGVEFAAFLDTRRENPGPEWKLSGYADSEWGITRVKGWNDTGTPGPACGRARFSKDSDPPVAWFRVPNDCLNIRDKVRVSVAMKDPGHGVDWVPARREFSRWV